MRRQAYFPSRLADQIIWLENFRNKITSYATALGLTVTEAAEAVLDARWVIYILGTWQPGIKNYARSIAQVTEDALTGAIPGTMLLPVCTAPALPVGVTARPAGALKRLFALINRSKDAPGYTLAIGADLGILGLAQTPLDPATIAPTLTLKLTPNGVFLGWGWSGHSTELDLVEMEVNRNDGKGWVLLTYDSTPDYLDTHPFPATPSKWSYRAIYHIEDSRVGLWSPEVSITVG